MLNGGACGRCGEKGRCGSRGFSAAQLRRQSRVRRKGGGGEGGQRYSKLVYLDSDLLVLDNLDHLFDQVTYLTRSSE